MILGLIALAGLLLLAAGRARRLAPQPVRIDRKR